MKLNQTYSMLIVSLFLFFPTILNANEIKEENLWKEITTLQNQLPKPQLNEDSSKEERDAYVKDYNNWWHEDMSREKSLFYKSVEYWEKYPKGSHTSENLPILAKGVDRYSGGNDSTVQKAQAVAEKLLLEKDLAEDIAYQVYHGVLRGISWEINWGIDINYILKSMDSTVEVYRQRYPNSSKIDQLMEFKNRNLTISYRTTKSYHPQFSDLQDFQKAYDEFKQTYILAEGEDLKYIPIKNPKPRMAYYYYHNSGQAAEIPWGPVSMLFLWDGELKNHGMAFGGAFLSSPIKLIPNIFPYEIDGDTTLINIKIDGDFIYRKDLSKERFIELFEAICNDQMEIPVKFRFQEEQRKVYIARGDFQLKLMKDRPFKSLEIYGKELEDPNSGGGGSGDLNEFLRWVGMYIHRWVIAEDLGNAPTEELSWHNNYELKDKGDVELVLKHITEQTGLTFREETRNVRMLYVERVN